MVYAVDDSGCSDADMQMKKWKKNPKLLVSREREREATLYRSDWKKLAKKIEKGQEVEVRSRVYV